MGDGQATPPSRAPDAPDPARPPRRDVVALGLALPAFVALALVIYQPCFRGGFVSDDVFAVQNPFLTPLSVQRVVDLFSPYGAIATMQAEYRPLWYLLHGLERQVFGDSVAAYPAYHLTNIIVHSLVSWLLILLFTRSGLPTWWALLGGALFLVHPGNVEAVGWISQLTSDAAMAWALGALLLAGCRPAAALLCFTLALLTKPLAVFALPVAALFVWVERSDARQRVRLWAWLGLWTAVLAGFTAVESIAAQYKQFGVPPMHPDPVVVARTIVANFLRYLVMAATGYGLSAFHQARPALSWLDPWWLGGAGALIAMAWRALHALARRRQEGVYWSWVLVAFAPISQVVPLIYPVADRYLYFLLPGLIGGALLATHTVVQRCPPGRQRTAVRLGGSVALMLLLVFAVQARARAGLWVSFEQLAQDSARHYPDGLWAHLLRARRAAQDGDGERSAVELRAAFELGNRDYSTVMADPIFRRVLRHPSFQKLLVDMADWWISRVNVIDQPNQLQLYQLANAYWLRGDFAEAQHALERAQAVGGPLDQQVQADLSRLRRQGP
jgi:hypothetical protein